MSSQAQQAREALGARLREVRKDAGLTGRALAAAAGWQLSKVSKIEHGKQNPTEDDIRAWCAQLSTVVEFLGTPDDVEAGVAARMERQQILYRGNRRLACLLGEQALYARVGGAEVMRGQLDRLRAAMSLPRLSLGIIPAAGPTGVVPGEAFIMFDERTVMVETVSAELTITQLVRETTRTVRQFTRPHGGFGANAGQSL